VIGGLLSGLLVVLRAASFASYMFPNVDQQYLLARMYSPSFLTVSFHIIF
jgi:hypothetical protein